VEFDSRAAIRFDVVSLGLGSLPALPERMASNESSWTMRPLAPLIDRLTTLEADLRKHPRPFHLVVVGGGASGCELSLAIAKRFSGIDGFRMTLLQSTPRLVPQFPEKAATIFAELLQQRRIDMRLNTRVVGGKGNSLSLSDGASLTFDAVLWATNAAPLPLLLSANELKTNDDGFLLVGDTLQSVSDPAVFGTGDCISMQSRPDLPKNGVYAVRQGAVLFENISRFLQEKPLVPFRPQRRCLSLLNASDGAAILAYGPFVHKGTLARRLKDRIDRAWIEKFQSLAPMTTATGGETDSPQMRCGGCGNKVSSDVLSAVLKQIDVGDDPRIVMGTRAGEDASVYRTQPELFGRDPSKLVEVQTVDYFKAFIDDPYLFGRIAAINAVSDLFAMNARPFTALAIATLPYARGPVQEGMLYELLTGAVRTLRELGVTLAGGHTTEGAEMALGFSVTGHAEEDRLFKKGNLKPGDLLILTKPLGSGALLAAWMRGACAAEWYATLLETMLVSNKRGSEIFAEHGIQACTDVTGFGLAGHLLEMLDASQADATLSMNDVPTYSGFAEVVQRGIVSTLHGDNAKAACRVHATVPLPAWLFDPQTSGGLLASVKPQLADRVISQLRGAGYLHASVIGEVLSMTKPPQSVIRAE
jgi:selenide,water dikinase